MWSDQLRELLLGTTDTNEASLSDQVKRANIEIYNEVTDEYGEHHDGSQPYSQTLLFLKALADDFRSGAHRAKDSQRVLVDVGCATGASLDRGGWGYQARVGVDISLGNLRAVRERGHLAVLADAEKLPFAAGSVDLITCFATLHHFPAPEAFVVAAGQCLAEDGVLMIAGEPSPPGNEHGPISETRLGPPQAGLPGSSADFQNATICTGLGSSRSATILPSTTEPPAVSGRNSCWKCSTRPSSIM